MAGSRPRQLDDAEQLDDAGQLDDAEIVFLPATCDCGGLGAVGGSGGASDDVDVAAAAFAVAIAEIAVIPCLASDASLLASLAASSLAIWVRGSNMLDRFTRV